MNLFKIIFLHLFFFSFHLAYGLETPKAIMPSEQFKVLDKYCLQCHDQDTSKGEINLEDLSFNIGKDIKTAELWDEVLAVMNAGEMPPEDKKQLKPEEKTKFLDLLSNNMVTARKILSDNGGKAITRRLNQREYKQSIKSLLGVEPDVSLLPTDDHGEGFDTFGSDLFFSSDQFENYYKTAIQTLEDAFLAKRELRKLPEPIVYRVDPELKQNEYLTKNLNEYLDKRNRAQSYFNQNLLPNQKQKPIADFGFSDEKDAKKSLSDFHIRVLSEYFRRPESRDGVIMYSINGVLKNYFLPPIKRSSGGTYKIRIKAGAYENSPTRKRYLEYGIKKTHSHPEEILGQIKLNGTIEKPEVTEFEVEAPHIWGAKFFVRHRDYKHQSDRWRVHRSEIFKDQLLNASVWVDYMEMEGPFFKKGLEVANSQIPQLIKDKPKDTSLETIYKKIFTEFATKAFRGVKPTDIYIDALMKRFTRKSKSSKKWKFGPAWQFAVLDGYATILSSPLFLFLHEPNRDETSRVISDRELAIRMSYFLWSSPPDKILLDSAKQNKLSDPELLKKQTQRLIDHPNFSNFISSYVHQWLDMKRLEMFDFDVHIHPTFDETVRRSARQEIYQTILHLTRNNLSLSNLLKSDTILVNNIMAEFYNLPNIDGAHFRPVKVKKGQPRGGLLATSAVMVMGSDGTRSSPVERGTWVLRHLLHNPPPPAPANVPMLSRISEKLGARSLQKAHMEEPQCAQCHRKIDPIGYALENFDAAGLWREKELSQEYKNWKMKTETFPIDARGSLSSGETFNGFFELRDVIAKKFDHFSEGFTEHLIAYALGRDYSISDYSLKEDIIKYARKHNFTISSYIHGLIQSNTFRKK